MSYEKFAYLYDQLMIDAPYEEWVSFVLKMIETNNVDCKKLLDVGCGTGNIAIPLNKQGISVTAVDLSEEMLLVAQQKSEREDAKVRFFQQDMRHLESLGLYNVVISLCDTINYLADEAEVASTFQGVFEHLDESGMFIFDVHTPYKINKIFNGSTYAYNGEEISYIWECFQGEESNSVEHDLSFFVQTDEGLYERFDELHKQRTYSLPFYKNALEESGFEIITITSDFSTDTFNENGERWFFVAKK